MCPKQGMEPCQKHFQAHRERQGYILLARGRMGPPGCGNKRAGGKREFVVDSGTCMHMVSKDHEDIEKSDDGDDGQRRRACKRRGNGIRP